MDVAMIVDAVPNPASKLVDLSAFLHHACNIMSKLQKKTSKLSTLN
jgi:hypothetical protein